jgi:hypothetical protein
LILCDFHALLHVAIHMQLRKFHICPHPALPVPPPDSLVADGVLVVLGYSGTAR